MDKFQSGDRVRTRYESDFEKADGTLLTVHKGHIATVFQVTEFAASAQRKWVCIWIEFEPIKGAGLNAQVSSDFIEKIENADGELPVTNKAIVSSA